jgi:hypothetical protein
MYPAVELIQNAKGLLQLRTAPPNADVNMTFGESDLAALFATMAGADAQVDEGNLTLFGDTYADGSEFPQGIPCANLKPSGWGLSYESWQLAKFVPTSYALRLKFNKPQLWVFSDGFVMGGGKTAKRAPLAIKRIDPNAKAETPKQPAKQPLQRRAANA